MKKVLIITYYWLPYAGTGTYRISKLVKYLKKAGWDPIILTPQKAAVAQKEIRRDPLYKDIKVFHTKIFEPVFFFSKKGHSTQNMGNASFFLSGNLSFKQRLMRWIRVQFFIPDAKMFWKCFAVREGKKIIKKERPELIFSTAPPPTTHLVARKLAKWSHLPWVADFRDPWTHIFYYEGLKINPLSARINKNLERRVLRDADKIVTVSDDFFPDTALGKKGVRIENGFDPDDLSELEPAKTTNKKFTIRYTGTLKINQLFENFIKVLKGLAAEAEFREGIKFETVGSVDATIKNFIEGELKGIEVNFREYMPHQEAIRQMAGADLLILAIGKGMQSKNVVSTKIFEYLMVGTPILAFGHLDGAANRILRETEGGKMFDYGAEEEVRNYFFEHYSRWKSNQPFASTEKAKINQYSFEKLTERLSKVLENCLENQKKKLNDAGNI